VAQFEAFISRHGRSGDRFRARPRSARGRALSARGHLDHAGAEYHVPERAAWQYGLARSHCARRLRRGAQERGGRQQIRCRLARRAASCTRARANSSPAAPTTASRWPRKLAEQHKEVEVQLQYAELLLSAGKPREAEKRLNDILATTLGWRKRRRALAFLAMTEQRVPTPSVTSTTAQPSRVIAARRSITWAASTRPRKTTSPRRARTPV